MPETALLASPWTADLLLRGGVGAVLAFHVVHLSLPGPRPAARAALALFSLSLIAYLFCQRRELFVVLPHALTWVALALCVSATAWLWLAARALFDDRFAFSYAGGWRGAGHGRARLGGPPRKLASRLGRLAIAGATRAGTVARAGHAGFTAAALWEVVRGWRDDLVEPRRAVRRWVALGIGLYATVAVIVELAVRGRDVGALLPALHVLGIGTSPWRWPCWWHGVRWSRSSACQPTGPPSPAANNRTGHRARVGDRTAIARARSGCTAP